MCLQISLIKPWNDWNWNGDEIVHKPIVPASRPIPGRKNRTRYDIDIREYLTTANNAVVSKRLGRVLAQLSPVAQSQFRSKAAGSFDFRADTLLESFSDIRYLSQANLTGRLPDAWLYPDETLAQGGGDCEDLAFLLAALLLASGISNYCIRVALGTVHIALPDGARQTHDHCWVMYQNEAAIWEILEPMTRTASKRVSPKSPAHPAALAVEYVPHYVFNTDHLWQIHSRDLDRRRTFQRYCQQRRFWSRFDPTFAAGVHNTIFDQALGSQIPASALSAIKRKSLWLDANILAYDPRDHFDDGFISEAWAQVNANLAKFQADNSDWGSFAAAAHAIGDFYAHSSYVHFAPLQNAASPQGQAIPYDPSVQLVAAPAYTATPADPSLPPFDLTSNTFSMNPSLWKGTKPQAAAQWAGQLVSGRYAQQYDPVAGFFEGLTSMPRDLPQTPGYSNRGALPHHNEIAVDDSTPASAHRLYRQNITSADDRQSYANQFRWRKNTAIQHIRKALADNYHP
jgi:hypothetical protein